MTSSFFALMKHLPSVQVFNKRILDDIAEQRSVVVLLPATIDPDWLWSLLADELWHRDYRIGSVDLSSQSISYGLAAAIGDTFNVSWPSASTSKDLASLLSSEGLPDLILLNGVENLDEHARAAWLRLVDQWARISQNLPSRVTRVTVICTILHRASSLSLNLESNVRLGIHWWWGFPSTLELRLLCRLADDGRSSQLSRWKEHLLPALVGSDVCLLENLWYDAGTDLAHLLPTVRSYAESRDWSRERLREWGVKDGWSLAALRNGGTTDSPPKQNRMLWACGALHCTPEHGVELHAAALAVLGLESELQHRSWRGQAELLLPSLDGIRLEICSFLTRRYGHDWPVRWQQPEHPDEEAAVRSTPLACGWGYLEWLIRKCSALDRERRWLSLITPASQARNTLAHYRMVGFNQYERIVDQYQRFLRTTCC